MKKKIIITRTPTTYSCPHYILIFVFNLFLSTTF